MNTRDILDYRPENLYCAKCGKRLVLIREKDASYYDRGDGHKVEVTYHFYRCPNKRRWWLFDEHEEFDDEPHVGFY